MAHITAAYTSNFDASFEGPTLSRQGKPNHWPPILHTAGEKGGEAPVQVPEAPHSEGPVEEWGDGPSAGTNSSTSDDRPDKSGSSVPETGSSPQSPAHDAESHSEQDQASSQAQSSTASSTSGSTQETGASQPGPSNSSEGQQTEAPSGTEATPLPSGRELVQEARQAYDARNWDEARALLEAAKVADPSLTEEVGVALQAVQTASEQTPSAGGFLVQ